MAESIPTPKRGLIDRIRGLLIRGTMKGAPEELDKIAGGKDGDNDTGLGLGPGQGPGAGDPKGFSDLYYEMVKIERTRMAGYIDFDLMDEEYPELASALDIYADNAVAGEQEEDDHFAVECEDERAKEVIDDINKRVGMENAIWSMTRDLCKYGDEFEEVVIDRDNLVARLKALPQEKMYRNQDAYGNLLPEKAFEQKDKSAKVIAEFQPWQLVARA